MSKRTARMDRIKMLAYLHRYVYPVAVVILPLLTGPSVVMGMGIGFLMLGLYDWIGYRQKWKHLYCSYQSAHRRCMTPDDIRWNHVKKSEIFTVIGINIGMGVLCVIVQLFLI